MPDLEKILRPKSIALIGVSRKEGSLGKKFLDAILRMNYNGKIYPINPKAEQISGIPCFPDLETLPEKPDLAVVLLPSKFVLDAIKELGESEIKNVIVVSAGFKEIGGEGTEREKQLVALANRYGMNLLGPNCMGLFNTDPSVSFNGTFSPTLPNPGHVAYISQSGALGVAIMELAADTDLGFSVFVSTGNKAIISDHDVLEFLRHDLNTHVATLYLESIDDPRKFREVCSQLVRQKPILAVKAGRTDSGKRAASSHTGALANPEYIMKGFLKQSGVIRFDTLEEMFDAARALAAQPLPKGPNVAVVTNAGGPGILASDALEQHGLKLAQLEDSTVQKLKAILPEEAACSNPVDMIASADHDTYHDVMEFVLHDFNVDAVILIIVKPPVDTTPALIAENLEPAIRNCGKTILPVLMAQRDESAGIDVFKRLNLPVFSYPESAVKALSKMWQYHQTQQRFFKAVATAKPTQLHSEPLIQTDSTHSQVPVKDIMSLLDEYKIPVVEYALTPDINEMIEFMNQHSAPVVLKIANERIIHKTDEGLVQLNIGSAEELKAAFDKMKKRARKLLPDSEQPLFLIQKQLKTGLELALGGKRDPLFGSILMMGLGGIFIEVLKDVSFRIAPVNAYEAEEMLKELKSQALLNGFRNIPPLDRHKFAQLIQHFSLLISEHPEISEIDLNPIIWTADTMSALVVDARATFAERRD
ncbi:MAG: acetate--CoA ligase family protein [Calditrichaeota bacterium]|nr:acetate--CoA ligase family protein [Calditrichota bacterium]